MNWDKGQLYSDCLLTCYHFQCPITSLRAQRMLWVIHEGNSLIPRPLKKWPGNFHKFKLVLPLLESTNQISEHCHMTTAKPNCVMHWTIAVTPISLQEWLLDCTSVGAPHDEICSNDFYFTSVVELTANSCFHEQESPILTAGKIVSITCTRLFEWDIAIAVMLHPYTIWTHGSCQAISPTVWEGSYAQPSLLTAQS